VRWYQNGSVGQKPTRRWHALTEASIATEPANGIRWCRYWRIRTRNGQAV